MESEKELSNIAVMVANILLMLVLIVTLVLNKGRYSSLEMQQSVTAKAVERLENNCFGG